MIKTSREAYSFACSVTGFGLESTCESLEAVEPVAAPVKRDALDYSRFAQIGVEEQETATAAVERQAESLVRSLTGAKPSVAQKPAAESTSEFFDLRKSAAMQGCAHDRSKERALFERPNAEKLHLASRFRVDGNAHFKDREYLRAANCYLRGLIQLEYTFPETPEEESRFNDIKLALHLNQAAAKLNLEDYDECAIQCEHALKLDPANAKALYRKAQCQIVWGKYDEAIALLKQSAGFEPSTAAACDAAAKKAAALKHAKADRAFYTNIFQQKR